MNTKVRKVVVAGGVRIPFARSFAQYSRVTNQEMSTAVLKKLAEKYNLVGKKLGDVAMGAVMQQATDWNLTREAVLGSGLHPDTPGYNVQRACGTSLETTLQIAHKIALGEMEVGIAGGTDTNSDLPVSFKRQFGWKLLDLRKAKDLKGRAMAFSQFRPKDLLPDFPAVVEPRTGMSMGQHCERMVQEWNVSRAEQDQLALESHQKGAAAYEEGFYTDIVFEYKGLKRDGNLRGDTSLDKLAKLKPVFDTSEKGSLTAGNSTPLTDGAGAILLCTEEYAQKNNIPVSAYFADAQVAALDFVKGEGLLMAPTIAVSEMLSRNNLSLQDFDYYEIHEAFAGQLACTLKAWESAEYCKKRLGREKALGSIDRAKLNIKGGSVALGHPFGATGARIVAGLAKILSTKQKGRGLISICTGGGMGVAAIMER